MSLDAEPDNTFYLKTRVAPYATRNYIANIFLLPRVKYTLKKHDDLIIISGSSPYEISKYDIRIAYNYLQECVISNNNNNVLFCGGDDISIPTNTSIKLGHLIKNKFIAIIIVFKKDNKNLNAIPPKLVKVTCDNDEFYNIKSYDTDNYTRFVVDMNEYTTERPTFNFEFINVYHKTNGDIFLYHQ